MIVPKDEVADILAGEQDEAHVAARGCEVGTVEAVRTSKSSKPVCWVFILERWEHRDGGLVVRFRRAPAPHEPRYLARQAGLLHPPQYTGTSVRALQGEPECISEQEQAEMSKPLSQRDHLLRLERKAAERVAWNRQKRASKRERKRAA